MRLRTWITISFCLLGWGGLPPDARSEETADFAHTSTLTLHPAGPATPLLRHELFPRPDQRKPGNAAEYYYKALLEYFRSVEKRYAELEEKCEALADDKLPHREIEALQSQYIERNLLYALWRQRAEWNLPFNEEDPVSILLPEVQSMRGLARLHRLTARSQLAQGKMEPVLQTLSVDFSMANHVAQGETIIHGLIGVAIAEKTLETVDQLVQIPGAPNLYWPLTMLPQPLCNVRVGVEAERSVFPWLKQRRAELAEKVLSAEDAQQLAEDMNSWGVFKNGTHSIEFLIFVARAYPPAKRRLIAAGLSESKVEAMPVIQVVTLDAVKILEEYQDRFTAASALPYWQIEPVLQKMEADLATDRRFADSLPLTVTFLPAVTKVHQAFTRLERRIAMLRIVEALRTYAANHNGKLPQKLSEVTEVPLPLDPATNREFDYSLAVGTATLTTPRTSNANRHAMDIQYTLRMEP